VNNVTFLPWVDPHEATRDVVATGEVEPAAGNVVTLAGVDCDDAELEDADAEIASPDVETALLRALTRRDMSEREVRSWLAVREVPENDAEEWVERMHRLGYVDDARMATHLVDKLANRGGKGRGVIVQKLTERGIDRATASDAVSHLDDDSQQEQATDLAVARASRMGSLTDEAARRRLHGFLARRGFSSTVIREAVQHALGKPG
jgi:regulatory protein